MNVNRPGFPLTSKHDLPRTDQQLDLENDIPERRKPS